MKYYCEMCDRAVDDNGPYERADGDYECQDCMEAEEVMLEQGMENYFETKEAVND